MDTMCAPPGLPPMAVNARGRQEEFSVRNTFIHMKDSPEPSASPVRRHASLRKRRQPRPSSVPPDMGAWLSPNNHARQAGDTSPSSPKLEPRFVDTPECSPSPRHWGYRVGNRAWADSSTGEAGEGGDKLNAFGMSPLGGDQQDYQRRTSQRSPPRSGLGMVQTPAKAKPRLGSVFAGGSDDEGPEYAGTAAWFPFPELGEDAAGSGSPRRSSPMQRLVGVEAASGPAYAQPSDEAICEFMEKWNLDERCERSLRSLSPRQQHEIMANFAPTENSKNTSAKFLLWLSPRLQQVEGRPPVTPDELRHFADKWSLDMRSRRILEELPPVVQCQVLTSFQPPPGTENVDAKLLSFARLQVYRAAARGRRRKGGAAQPQERGRQPALGGACEEADRESSPFMMHVDTGSPHPPRRGRAAPAGLHGPAPAGLPGPGPCMAPPPGALAVAPGAPPPGAFAAPPGPPGPQGTWWPQPLPQEAPQDSLPWGVPRVPPQLAPAVLPPPPQWMAAPPALPQTLTAPPAAPPPAHLFQSDTVRSFVEHWGLDEKCAQSLLQLPAPQQQAVMAGFNPSKKTSNVNKKFMAFCRLWQDESQQYAPGGEGAGMPQWHDGFRFHGPWGQGDHGAAEAEGEGRGLDPKVRAFVEHWELDAECEQHLLQLTGPQQHLVMSGFNPSMNTTNMSRKFMAFSRGKLQDAKYTRNSPSSAGPHRAAQQPDLIFLA